MKELEKISQKTPGEVMLSIQGQVIKPKVLLAHVNLAAYNLILEREKEERNTDYHQRAKRLASVYEFKI